MYGGVERGELVSREAGTRFPAFRRCMLINVGRSTSLSIAGCRAVWSNMCVCMYVCVLSACVGRVYCSYSIPTFLCISRMYADGVAAHAAALLCAQKCIRPVDDPGPATSLVRSLCRHHRHHQNLDRLLHVLPVNHPIHSLLMLASSLPLC